MYPGLPSRFVFLVWLFVIKQEAWWFGFNVLCALFVFSLEKEIQDRYLDTVLKGNKDGLKVEYPFKFMITVIVKFLTFLFCFFLVNQKLRLRIEDPPRRKHMVYLGGAVLAGIMKVERSSMLSSFATLNPIWLFNCWMV